MNIKLDANEQKKIKRIELDILKAFIRVCDILKINYYCLGGTLLGAIRHSGFIPWDDDIDVGLLRRDYEKFVLYGQKYLPDKIFLQTNISDKYYPLNFAKLRDSQTTFVEESMSKLEINHGVYIDIFPIDVFPRRKIQGAYIRAISKLYFWRISSVFCVPSNYGIIKKVCKKLVVLFATLFTCAYSLDEVVKKREALFQRFNDQDSPFLVNYCGAWGKKEIFNKDWLQSGQLKSFETITVRVPEQFDLYLKQVYGDYMEYPPVEKQTSHHYCQKVDLDRPFDAK